MGGLVLCLYAALEGANGSQHMPSDAAPLTPHDTQPPLLLTVSQAAARSEHSDPSLPHAAHNDPPLPQAAAALAHQADFDVCWCKGSVSDRIFLPLVDRIKQAGGSVQVCGATCYCGRGVWGLGDVAVGRGPFGT